MDYHFTYFFDIMINIQCNYFFGDCYRMVDLGVVNCYAYATIIMDEDGDLLVGDLRGGQTVDCYINDEVAEEKLAEYLK